MILVWEEIMIIRVLLETPFHRRTQLTTIWSETPHSHLIGDPPQPSHRRPQGCHLIYPKLFIGDPRFVLLTQRLLSETSNLSLETPVKGVSWLYSNDDDFSPDSVKPSIFKISWVIDITEINENWYFNGFTYIVSLLSRTNHLISSSYKKYQYHIMIPNLEY